MISRCKFCKNGFFNTFFPLSHTFYFEIRPSPLSKIGENAFGAHFLQLYSKNEYCDPHFLFYDFNKDRASFRWAKNWRKSMFSFLAILLNWTDLAITGLKARVCHFSRNLREFRVSPRWITVDIPSMSSQVRAKEKKNAIHCFSIVFTTYYY